MTSILLGPKLGSDHIPVVLYHGQYKFIVWNLEVGRNAVTVWGEVRNLIRHYQPQALLLQETSGYAHLLSKVPAYRFVVGDQAGSAQTAILVHKDVPAGPGFARFLAKGWRANHFKPRGITSVKLVNGPRLTSVHAPQDKGFLRRVARVVFMRRLRRFIANHHGEQITAGDWNATTDVTKRWSPRWIARKTGSRLVATTEPTHAHHRGPIDYAIITKGRK